MDLSGRPMLYGTQRALIQYLPADLRVALVRRAPRFRNIEAKFAYRLRSMHFERVGSRYSFIDSQLTVAFDGIEFRFSPQASETNLELKVEKAEKKTGRRWIVNIRESSYNWGTVLSRLLDFYLGRPGTTLGTLHFGSVVSADSGLRTMQQYPLVAIRRSTCALNYETFLSMRVSMRYTSALTMLMDVDEVKCTSKEFCVEDFFYLVRVCRESKRSAGTEFKWQCTKGRFTRYTFLQILDVEGLVRTTKRIRFVRQLEQRTEPLRLFYEMAHADLIVTHRNEKDMNTFVFNVIEKGSARKGDAFNF